MIQAAIKNTEKGAVLTTHYLAEAEAICDRVAIMVSGRLRWVAGHTHTWSPVGPEQSTFPCTGLSPYRGGSGCLLPLCMALASRG